MYMSIAVFGFDKASERTQGEYTRILLLFGNKCSLVALFSFSVADGEFSNIKIPAQETTQLVVFVNQKTRNTILYGYAFVG